MSANMEKAMRKELQKSVKELRVLTVEAQEIVWRLAPRDWVGKRKAAIANVARLLGWEFPRTWNIAHGRARRIDAHEMDALRAELNKLEEGAVKRRESLDELEARLAFLRSSEGSGGPGRSGEGAASAGGRSDRAGSGGVRTGEHAVAVVSGR